MYEVGADGFASVRILLLLCWGLCVPCWDHRVWAGAFAPKDKLVFRFFFPENLFLGFFSLAENLSSQRLNGIVRGKGIVGRGGGVSQNNHYRKTCNFSASQGDAFSPESRISFGILSLL